MSKHKASAAPQTVTQSASTAGIPLPSKGFEPSKVRSGISQEMRDFFTRAWEQYQSANPQACITDVRLVRALRKEWYDYLEERGYNRNTASVVAGEWYAQDSVKRNPAYIRNSEVLARIKG